MKYLSGNPFFDPKMPVSFWQNNLPHWEQDGKIHYLTFRLHDSLPKEIVDNYRIQKEQFLRLHPRPWDDKTKKEYSNLVSNPIENFLDAGYGGCFLKDHMVRQYLIDAMDYYDGERICVLAYVIMPNHVHLLAVPLNGYELNQTMTSILRFSATKINQHIGRRGTLWQDEPYDSIVRSHLQYVRCLEYIKHNPDKLPIGWYAFGGLEFR